MGYRAKTKGSYWSAAGRKLNTEMIVNGRYSLPKKFMECLLHGNTLLWMFHSLHSLYKQILTLHIKGENCNKDDCCMPAYTGSHM